MGREDLIGKGGRTILLKGSTDSKIEPSSHYGFGSAEEISVFVEQLAREFFLDVPGRRCEPRYRVTLPVVAQPVGNDFRPVGPSIRAVTRELSARGIGLICQDPLNQKLIVHIARQSGDDLRVLAQVVRCVTSGYYYDVGCKILTEHSC